MITIYDYVFVSFESKSSDRRSHFKAKKMRETEYSMDMVLFMFLVIHELC